MKIGPELVCGRDKGVFIPIQLLERVFSYFTSPSLRVVLFSPLDSFSR